MKFTASLRAMIAKTFIRDVQCANSTRVSMTVPTILLKWVSNCLSRLPYDSGVASKIKRILGNVIERSNHILRSANSSSIVLLCNDTRPLLPYKKITNMCFCLVPFFLPKCPANSVIIFSWLFIQCSTFAIKFIITIESILELCTERR